MKAVEVPLSKVEEAKRDVEEAESSLEAFLAELKVSPRAEKTSVSATIETALTRLRHARVALIDAETVLVEVAKSSG